MNEPSALSGQWAVWLNEALSQGMTAEKAVETLINQGFTPREVRLAMGANFPSHLSFTRDDNFYQRMASPGFLDGRLSQRLTQHAAQLYTVDDVFSKEECRKIHKLSLRRMQPSQIAKAQTGELTKFRTSRTCYLYKTDDPFVEDIEHRLWSLVAPQQGDAEVVQAQHYRVGQHFKPHHDYFTPGTDAFTSMGRNGGQRTWTCMVYITAPTEGGETTFTEHGVSLKPVSGQAVIWLNLHNNGTVNPQYKHYAKPVLRGEKLVLTKWFRESKIALKHQRTQSGPRSGMPLGRLLNR